MPTNTSESGILTIKEVAEYLKVTERTIYRLAAAKKIPAFKVGGTWRFRASGHRRLDSRPVEEGGGQTD
jgi:excisionase family DNA binding protein